MKIQILLKIWYSFYISLLLLLFYSITRYVHIQILDIFDKIFYLLN